jgi:hypothetical protein
MLDFLRDSAWQGVAGIIAGISLLLYVYVERDKLFGGINKRSRFILYFIITIAIMVLLASIIILSLALDFGANTITHTLITNLNRPIGIMLAATLLGAGLASFFSISHYILFRNYIINITKYVMVIFLGLIFYGIWTGILLIPQISNSLEQVARILFEWGRGVFIGINVVTIALILDKFFEQRK